MVDFVSSLGTHLGSAGAFEFHEFPSLERLSAVSEEELRQAGFGYRAKHITGTVDVSQSKPDGGAQWLLSLRKLYLQEAIDALCSLPGVCPKIATRYFLPELADARLRPKLCNCVPEAFVSKYWEYAGWAQTLLFVAELPSQKALLPSLFQGMEEKRSSKRKDSKKSSSDDSYS